MERAIEREIAHLRARTHVRACGTFHALPVTMTDNAHNEASMETICTPDRCRTDDRDGYCSECGHNCVACGEPMRKGEPAICRACVKRAARNAFDDIITTMEASATDYGDDGTVADEDMPDGTVRAHFTGDRYSCVWDLYNGSMFDNIDYSVTANGTDWATIVFYGYMPNFGDSARRS